LSRLAVWKENPEPWEAQPGWADVPLVNLAGWVDFLTVLREKAGAQLALSVLPAAGLWFVVHRSVGCKY